jgi:hypothetical protein
MGRGGVLEGVNECWLLSIPCSKVAGVSHQLLQQLLPPQHLHLFHGQTAPPQDLHLALQNKSNTIPIGVPVLVHAAGVQ